MSETEEFALCRGCGKPTRQRVVRLAKPDGEVGYVVVPVYHTECISPEKQHGRQYTGGKK